MLRSTLLLTFASLALVDASRVKHNDKDELLPTFNYFGYTDLDVLDFFTGVAERGFGKDVRENWQFCFHYLSFTDVFNRFLATGVLGWMANIYWNMLVGQKDFKDFDAIVPDQCHEVSHEFDKLALWYRDNAISPFGTIMYIYHAVTSVGKETFDIIDVFGKIAAHDFYGAGMDVADIFVSVNDGYGEW